jgi:hypothetical protein
MASNSNISLASLDFDTLKSQFKSYLTNQSVFKDYNFDGSNMAVLLDVMTYNSYLNSFYLNMVASEMFLDSAQLYNSVVSHAKELNYVPLSAKSSVANVTFTAATTGINSPFSIPKSTTFTGTNSNGQYTFTTNQLQTFPSGNSTFTISGLKLYEGTYYTDSFVLDYTKESQRFVLTNLNIDTDSITVVVNESGTNTTFTQVDTLFGLDSTSNIYFLQGAQNNQYEIVFGDGFFGRIPNNLSVVSVNYRVTHGTDADGISTFLCTTNLGLTNGGAATLSTITSDTPTSGGANAQSIDSIRFSAPRYFATQQRAVASDDYSSLVLKQYGGQLDDVSVYGGETLEPKQYGRVVVCLKPSGGTIAPDYLKSQVSNYLSSYISLPTRVIISDPQYLYLGINTTVQYDPTATKKLVSELEGNLLNTIISYGSTNLGEFAGDFRYSRFVAAVDGTDSSFVSNNTEVNIIKRISPLLNYPSTFVIDYNNPADVESASPGYVPNSISLSDEPVLTSSAFTFVGSDGTNYPYSYLRDDNTGNVLVYSVINGAFAVLQSNIGTIDYTTGMVTINSLTTSYYGDYISLYMTPLNKDVIINQQKILLIDVNDVSVNVITQMK